MNRILVVSNRLPVNISKRNDKLEFIQSAGGLATGMSALQKTYEMVWIGWPGITRYTKDEKNEIISKLGENQLVPVFLTQQQVEQYYDNFSNRTIWPLFHYFTQYTNYEESSWDAYKNVNELFARHVLDQYHEGDMIWIHDYHLMLVPEMVRREQPDASIGYFLHIPFPSFEIFRYLPWRDSVLRGIMGADLIGFHTFDYARHFSSSIMRLQGLEHYLGQVFYDERMVRIDTFPMGINFEKYAGAPATKEVKKQVKHYKSICKESKVIISIDRLDYSKGILQRLHAFHQLLHDEPDIKGKVTLILLVVPSRDKVDSYQILKQEVDEFVGRINGEHGSISWTPIKYFYRSLPFEKVSALYSMADICLVTPFRDGMNLVAKEFVASKEKGDGVLILSEMAGSVNELSEAIVINPNDIKDIVVALQSALKMPRDEQQNRIQSMRNRLKRYDIYKWAEDYRQAGQC
ncbi:MAG: bifunctional alpha,alpha-trehalose-phosphate synthase (UDP-forming)/trehalose-phosphatase [candidate division KSB1 bacterium]|nr:bifunctional alpha,alpha-trehalose-phosphate synthase (UDP-forming)/trehalose-phosphatase [candidate division KSB1 bacterium]